MFKKRLYYFVAFTLLPAIGFSQYSFNRFSNPNEYIIGLGPDQFLGDLGGSSSIGTHFLKDFNFSAIRYSFEGGYRYHISPAFAVKGMLTAAMVYGSDALTTNNVRHNRNLNFRSPIIELSGQFEYYFYRANQIGHRYHIKHAHGFKQMNISAYLFLGFGGLYFNPQGQWNGAWYNLRPLSTEGEGLPGGPPEYSQFAICFPAGIGMKYMINKQWSVGLELSDRIWTSSDYIDDTHGNYFYNSEIVQYRGSIAGHFADPSLGDIPGATGVGNMRGDPTHNDTYMFLFVTLSYQPPLYHRTRSKF